jgi:hypothetical protein
MTGSLVAGAPGGAGRWSLAVGLLHVLEADPLTGGGTGSRAIEAQNFGHGMEAPAARLEVLRRALDAVVEPVTLPAGREGARPPFGDAA